MSKIKILSDSTCDIPRKLIEKHNITIVPICVRFDDEEFEDYYELTPEIFHEKIKTCKEIPATSLPTPQLFVDYFSKFDGEYDEILFISISSNGSGTFNAARLGLEDYLEAGGKAKVTLFDTLQPSSGIGYFVLKAAELLESGKTVAETVEILEPKKQNFATYIVVENMDFLRKGGRVSAATSFIGTLLGIKPIITAFEGFGKIYGKIRGDKKIAPELVELFSEQHDDNFVQVSHCGNLPKAMEVVDLLNKTFDNLTIILTEVGASLGTHAGPGAVSIHFLRKDMHVLV